MTPSLPRPTYIPPAPPRRKPWSPSIATFAFAVVVGVMLLLQMASIVPGGNSVVALGIAGPQSASSRQASQEAGHSSSQGAPSDVVGGLLRYEATAPTPAAEVNGAAERTPLEIGPQAAVASSRGGVEVTPTTTPVAGGPGGLQMAGCDYTHGSLYCVYEVQPGQTLSTIARLAGLQPSEGIAAHDLIVYSNAAELSSSASVLEVGEKLRIPTQVGIIHTIVSDETLSQIAAHYGVPIAAITDLPANNLGDGSVLKAGADILIPNPTRAGAKTVVAGGSRGSASAAFLWPVVGEITSEFGPDHPKGIDIALMTGDPVDAAGSGTVTFAGGDPCCSVGLNVIIDHGNGLYTRYGHLSVIQVKVGERVSAGEQIGLGGSTGYSTGPHVHFEVYVGTSLTDPLPYLP